MKWNKLEIGGPQWSMCRTEQNLEQACSHTFSYKTSQIPNNTFPIKMTEDWVPSTLLLIGQRINDPDGHEPGCLSSSFHRTVQQNDCSLRSCSWATWLQGASATAHHSLHVLLLNFFRSTYHLLKLFWLFICILTYFLSPQLESKLHEYRIVVVLFFTESLLSRTACDT